MSVLAWPAWAGDCRDDLVKLRGPWGQAQFTVEIADSVRERSRGLMFRDSLPKNGGMLFIYARPTFVSFWMKNTRIPLDMIFLDERGVVRRVHHDAVPGDLKQIPGGPGILAVLEINGGQARAFGIAEGSEMQHRAFDVGAAWPCE
ncbi:DUF192 domain-containing protein [Alisedimentitalea sp. MJ-SS2]|uniref:DUF192 domain-containing protein n=1 Tax=Aliisedimentitalea sp. MJ-SS2 TaxID=3049795 RepID=UPI002911795D|nr:DUF192 domain-containing protein [Alisedimentitalea sp. MJ-SS2]MDU8929724.1 DUF192 domain-containing protein [Alisedimentitalea sp. MJ-SS2]